MRTHVDETQLIRSIQALGLDFLSPQVRGSAHYANRDARDQEEALYGAQNYIQMAPDKGYAFWEVFKAVYHSSLRQHEWTGEYLLEGRPTSISILLDRLENVLGMLSKLTPEQLTRKLEAWIGDPYEARKVNPVRDELMRVQEAYPEDFQDWGRMAEVLFGAADPLSQQMLETWMVAYVRRILTPGCPFKYVLVLSGRQSIGKSPFFRILARMPGESKGSEAYYLKPTSKDSEDHLKRLRSKRWVIELGELEGLTGKMDVEDLKNILDNTTDTYKVNHKEIEISTLRHYVFGASVNSEAVFKDKTGNERFWVIPCDQRIALEWLEDNLDHIRATAVRKALGGYSIDPDREMAQQSEARNAGYMAGNEVTEAVEEIMGLLEAGEDGPVAIQSNSLLAAMPSHLKSTKHSNGIKQAMSNRGYRYGDVRVEGGLKVKAFHRPGQKPSLVPLDRLGQTIERGRRALARASDA